MKMKLVAFSHFYKIYLCGTQHILFYESRFLRIIFLVYPYALFAAGEDDDDMVRVCYKNARYLMNYSIFVFVRHFLCFVRKEVSFYDIGSDSGCDSILIVLFGN